jgi:NAD(P)H-nitrite reductase large subunit/NAD-dependent dihydropyrimidine dehydrogenase PreA subunit
VSPFDLFRVDRDERVRLASAWVVPEQTRCVQCGICTFSCPAGIDVRRHVWLGEPVKDSRCLSCGQCVLRCPRKLLRFEPVAPFVSPTTPRLSGPSRSHVLVGSGPGAITAAETIRRIDAGAKITIVSDDPHGYYSRPGLAYYLAKDVPESRLFPDSPEDFASLDVDLVRARVARVDARGHRIRLADGAEISYDRLLLATGSRAIPAEVPGNDLDGVVKLDDLEDARDIIRRSRRAKAAVVVGGGITAIEIVEGLRARGVRVHYFMRKDRYWSNVLSQAESDLVQRGLHDQGVQIHDHTNLGRIEGRDGKVTGVVTDRGETIACEIVAIALGVMPQKSLGEEAGLECARGVLVDPYLRSSDEDIYAAGDVAELRESPHGHSTLDVLWNSAIAKGRVAGTNMVLGPTATYEPEPPLNVTRLAGFDVTIIGVVGDGKGSDLKGLSRGDSQTWGELGEETVVESQEGRDHLRLALRNDAIAGAVVMGDQEISFHLGELISMGVSVSEILPRLRTPAAPLAEIIRAFRPEKGALTVG